MDFSKPRIMGILNVTPDSFSDGGQFFSAEQAIQQLHKLIADCADIIDVGGESSGPGSADVSAEEELARVKPVIDYIAEHKLHEHTLFSIDTYKAPVAEYALSHGFGMVNDVTALRGDPKLIDVLAQYQPYIVLMYSKDPTARTTKTAVEYVDVVDTIKKFLSERIKVAKRAGLLDDRIIIDPGMGMFVSANPKYSFEIIDRLAELKTLGHPILVGPSRKSFLGGELKDRDAKGWEVVKKAITNGVSIVRMHTII
ncbi:MAG: dihydropteroate synthase [Candidatus Peregrinibacteria bacterium]